MELATTDHFTHAGDNSCVSIGALMCTMVHVILITIHCIAREVYSKWYLNAFEIVFLINLMHVTWLGNQQYVILAQYSNSVPSCLVSQLQE